MVMPSSRSTVATLDLEILKWAPICWVVSPAWYRWMMAALGALSAPAQSPGYRNVIPLHG